MKKTYLYSILLSVFLSMLLVHTLYAAEITASQTTDMELELLKLINEERESHARTYLSLDTQINPVSNVRVSESVQSFSHTRPDGRRFSTAFTDQNICYRCCGEILAYGYETPELVLDAWLNSPGHRNTILSDRYTHVGVSHLIAENGKTYWAVEFLSR